MSLQQLNPEARIIFLKNFAEELLVNSLKEEESKKMIELGKLKKMFIEPAAAEEDSLKKVQPLVFPTPADRLIRKNPKRLVAEKMNLEKSFESLKRPIIYKAPHGKTAVQAKPAFQKSAFQHTSPNQNFLQIYPEAQSRPQGFLLGKLEFFLRDKAVQSIECPGPGKNLLVKKYSGVGVTQTTLSQQEITSIISSFSEQARIPVVGGILKAAVGNLVISAIISDFIGSRFIINKITPYSII